jgi:hypothetical protein
VNIKRRAVGGRRELARIYRRKMSAHRASTPGEDTSAVQHLLDRDIRVTRVSDSTAVLTYTATQDATCQGTKMPAKVSASSVWVKQGG